MKSLTIPNSQTRAFIELCGQGDINALSLFFKKDTFWERIKHLFIKNKNIYANYEIEQDYAAWFGLGIAAKNNNFELIDYLINHNELSYYLTKEATNLLSFTYKTFEPIPKLQMNIENIVRNKNYCVHICLNEKDPGTPFQYKEIKPIYIDIPLLKAIENSNYEMFFYILEKIHIKDFIDLDNYIIKFLKTLNSRNKERFLQIENIHQILESRITFALLEIIEAQNIFAANFLIEKLKLPLFIFDSLETKLFNQKQLDFYNELKIIASYKLLDKDLNKKTQSNKKILKI